MSLPANNKISTDKSSIQRDIKAQEEVINTSKTEMLKSRIQAATARTKANRQQKAGTQTQAKAQTTKKKSASEKDQAKQFFTQYATKMVMARLMQSNGATAAGGIQMQQSAMTDQSQGLGKMLLSDNLGMQSASQDANALGMLEKAALDYGKAKAKQEIAKKAGGDFEKSTAMLNLLNSLEAHANGQNNGTPFLHGADYLMDGGLLGKDGEDGSLDDPSKYYTSALLGGLAGDPNHFFENVLDGSLALKYDNRKDIKNYTGIAKGAISGDYSQLSQNVADKITKSDGKDDNKKSTNETASA